LKILLLQQDRKKGSFVLVLFSRGHSRFRRPLFHKYDVSTTKDKKEVSRFLFQAETIDCGTKSVTMDKQDTHKKIAIIGAGVAGCAMAGALQDHGIDFVVYDSNSRAGGLWADNYPGAKGMFFGIGSVSISDKLMG
jgi:hypothetical protein